MSQRASLIALMSLLVVLPAALAVNTVFAAGEEPVFQNVQLLGHVKSKKEMRALMKEQAKALGVKCTHCHVQGKFELDDKAPKRRAREMMRMVRSLNETHFPDLETGVTCWTCHAGREEPELTRPVGAQEGETPPAGG